MNTRASTKRKFSDISETNVKEEEEDSEYVELHEKGYVILEKEFTVSDKEFKHVKKYVVKKAAAIFNYNNDNKSDNKRKQSSISKKTKFIQKLNKHLQAFNDKLTAKNWVVLYSENGCQKQCAHCDYTPDKLFGTISDNLIPCGAIFAIQDGTTLDIWKNTIGVSNKLKKLDKPIKRETVNLNKGDLFIFRGDLIHAGSEYKHENIRIHAYMDSPLIHRTKNRTWTIKSCASKKISKYIID